MVKRTWNERKSEEEGAFLANIHCNLKVFLFFAIEQPIVITATHGACFTIRLPFRVGATQLGFTASVGSQLIIVF
jgi:hypothetical protein